jgi:hypothetical protein
MKIFTAVFDWLIGGGIAAIGKEIRQMRSDRFNAENDEKRIEAEIRLRELENEAAMRRQMLADPLLKMPLFLASFTASLYISAIFVDSTFPMQALTPLELPDWFKPHFSIVLSAIFGISVVERFLGRLRTPKK